MTNAEKWLQFTDGLPSPDNFIRWSYRYMISAALQRRVWSPPDHDRIYPNMYVALVGPPGTGKGGPIRAVNSIITEHKLKDVKHSAKFEGENKNLAKAAEDYTYKEASEEMMQGRGKSSIPDEPLVIPVAADAVTYEALVKSMATCVRSINYESVADDGTKKMRIYMHASQCFILEEMASLFRDHQKTLINFLIQAYDCSDTYEYRTKNSGRDRILKMCLNFIAGTTPEFMQESFDDAIIRNGYSSRTFFIYAAKNRKEIFFRPELTEAQKKYRAEISAHVKALTSLYGPIQFKPETAQFLQNWLEKFRAGASARLARAPKMASFEARINIHIMKVAMANHFGESTDMFIPQSTFEQAIEDILKEMPNMSLALTVGGDNPLSKVSMKVVEHLKVAGKKTFNELLVQFWEHCQNGKQGLEEILTYLQQTDQIIFETKVDETTGKQTIYYSAKE